MGYEIVKGSENSSYTGCDFVVRLTSDRENTDIRILQITDTQVIDASQRRTPDRLRADEISAWDPKNFDAQCGDHIRSLVIQTKPDLIIITGDIIYGSFDDSGSTFEWFCELMDSLETPWAPVYGNHDNESKKGVKWQCERFKKSRYCLFDRGNVSGNSNYSVGIAVEDKLIRVLHMLDSNGCGGGTDPSIIKAKGIYTDQLELVAVNTAMISKAQQKNIPAFMAFHIPVDCYEAAEAKYKTSEREYYNIGVDVPAFDGDFGFKFERYKPIEMGGSFAGFLHEKNIEGVFVGHVHNNCTCIDYDGIKWVFGLKTGQYDYHIPGQIGGTLITLEGDTFKVSHVQALVKFAAVPGNAPMYGDIFSE